MAERGHKAAGHARRPGGRTRLADALGLDLMALPEPVRAAIEALSDEALSLRAENQALRETLATTEALVDHDTLCPLFNRRAFLRELKREMALAARLGTPLCLLYLDLDGFKAINDRFGHGIGDEVLISVAALLRQETRETDIVARLGGDEFGIALPHAGLPDAEAKARTLTVRIDALTVADSERPELAPLAIGASCGVAVWRPGMTPERLIEAADGAMYAAKSDRKSARGKN